MGDNWKTSGNCLDCRRNSYCSSKCTKNKQREQRIFKQQMVSTMSKLIGSNNIVVTDSIVKAIDMLDMSNNF